MESSSRGAIDIFVVFFRAEMDRIQLLAESLAKFASVSDVNTIQIVYNGSDFGEVKDAIVAKIFPCLGVLAAKCAVHEASKVLSRCDWPSRHGWLSQQALKLHAHVVCRARFVLSLDAKFFLVRPLSLASLIDTDGAAPHGAHTDPWTRVRVDKARAYFGLEPLRCDEAFFVSAPPCLMSTQDQRKLDEYIQHREGKSLEEWFFEACTEKFTEYTLMHTFSEHLGLDASLVYKPRRTSLSTCFWPKWPAQGHETMTYIKGIEKENVTFVAVHRERIFTAEEHAALNGILAKHITVDERIFLKA